MLITKPVRRKDISSKQAWLLKDMKFFQRNAGGIVGECAKGALELARAKERMEMMIGLDILRIKWEDSISPDVSWMGDKEREDCENGRISFMDCSLQTVCLECGTWVTQESLCECTLLIDHETEYTTVVEAELALEYFARLDKGGK